jgi:hypothetical protein
MVCRARVWIETSTIKLVSRGNAAVQFFGYIQQIHNEKGLTCWHSAECTEHWMLGSHILSAIDGLIQSYTFKQKLQNLIPISPWFFLSFLRWRSFAVLSTKVAPFPQLMWGVVFTASVVFSFSFSANLWTRWSQPFCHRPQGETLRVLGTLFYNASERTQQQTRYLSPMYICKFSISPRMLCSSHIKGFGHSFALHKSQIHVSQPATWCHSQCSMFQTSFSHRTTFRDSDME